MEYGVPPITSSRIPGSAPTRPRCGCVLKVSTTATILVAKCLAASGLSRATKARIPADLHAPTAARVSLPAQRLVIVNFAANAFRRRQFTICAPGKQPRFHIPMIDVVAGLYLPIRLARFGQHPFL